MVKKLTRKVSSHFARYKRVWRLLKKPTPEEFKTVSKVSAIGILIIGAVGFAISVLMKLAL
jgi:protein transport protein SEC61 subunit gamma-like protein